MTTVTRSDIRASLAAAGIRVPETLPVEIDPAYALDAAGLAAAGLLLRAAD